MEKLIACCGLNCARCEARIATLTDDPELRILTAEKWKTQYGEHISPEMINCTGCREPGVKIGHCAECEIRNCVNSKGFDTCADCDLLENCIMTKNLHEFVPESLQNLRLLN